jgi:hypothetical protein
MRANRRGGGVEELLLDENMTLESAAPWPFVFGSGGSVCVFSSYYSKGQDGTRR